MPIIVIEGADGAGKGTQVLLLAESMRELGYDVKVVGYPVYELDSASTINKFLNKEYGENLDDLNPYQVSSFYANNRFDDFLSNWKKNYEDGDVIIIDRYTGSNIIHQAPRLKGKERQELVDWIIDFEQVKGGLPKPDLVFYLDVPPTEQAKILKERKVHKSGNSSDIIEENSSYNKKCRDFVLKNIDKLGWKLIERDTIPNVHNKLLELILPNIQYYKQGQIEYAKGVDSPLDKFKSK